MTTATKERPILFRGEMVRAILAGSKTQTRRAVRPSPKGSFESPRFMSGAGHSGLGWYCCEDDYSDEWSIFYPCPYGRRGDRLWVRECFSVPWNHGLKEGPLPCHYWVDGNPEDGDWTRPKPSIHMPRWACRLELEVVRIRAERLQAITEEDAKAEGVEPSAREDLLSGRFPGQPYSAAYALLWESLNAKRGFGWESNPWVWAISFRRVPPCR